MLIKQLLHLLRSSSWVHSRRKIRTVLLVFKIISYSTFSGIMHEKGIITISTFSQNEQKSITLRLDINGKKRTRERQKPLNQLESDASKNPHVQNE